MTEPHDVRPWRTEILVFIVILIWASNFPIAKWGLKGIEPLMFNALRYIVATAVLIALYFARSSWTPVKNDWPKIIGIGFRQRGLSDGFHLRPEHDLG
jgi:drug/metabolite transporter (DMT)-like permease